MDPFSFTINTTNEFRLRKHIREVLLPYARAHLTSDHVAYTEKVAEELLLQTLEFVPMADATSFFLPTDPFEALIHSRLQSLDLSPPEEKWATPMDHVRFLRSFFPPPPDPRDLQTEKCWHEDDQYYVNLSLICRPISSPILSKRARRETPEIGSTNSRASIPRTRSTLTAFLDLSPVAVQSIEDLPAPSVDDVLDLRPKLDFSTGARARSLLQSLLAPPMREKIVDSLEDTPNVPEFLNHRSPPRCYPSLDTPPLFPRATQRRSTHRGVRDNRKSGASNPTRISDLATMLQVASPELIDDEDGDINNHHMEVVSGWTTLKYSSPPPASLRSSDGSEVDDLWNMSPPGTPATSLIAAKMDEVEIPRIRKFGHKNTLANESTDNNGAANLLTGAKSPGFFITSFISAPIPLTQAHKPITSQLGGVESGMHSPHPISPGQSTSNSLRGQPPSAREEQANGGTLVGPADFVEDFEEQQFDDAIASIYFSTSQDPLSFIREERLDDKDIMLMDVPNLPPPTAHPKDPTLFPEGIKALVALKGEPGRIDTASHHGSNGFGPTAFLRPVKGIKPLALDLSWRPFNFGKTIPTDEEVAGIVTPIQPEDEVPGYRDGKYEKTIRLLLDLGHSLMSAENAPPTLIPTVPRGCEGFGTSPTPKQPEASEHFEYLLTQRERMRASGARISLEPEADVPSDVDTEQSIAPWPLDDEHGGTIARDERLRRHEVQGSQNPFDATEYHPRSRTDYGYFFDDSGIDIMDNNLDQFSTSEFGVPIPLLHPFQDGLLSGVDATEANKENVDNQGENKENIPPHDMDGYQLAEYQPDPPASQYDWSGYFEFPDSQTPPFEPLSFASQSRLPQSLDDLTNSKVQVTPPLTPGAHHVKHPQDDLVSMSECEPTDSRATKRRRLDDLVLASSKDLFSTFMGLRNKATSSSILEPSETRNDTQTPHQTLGTPEQAPRVAPDDVFDQCTVRLPEHWIPVTAVHRYLASMTLIQKRALVRALQGHQCQVVLVERYDLGGTDIIIDPDYGVLFVPLLALPAHLESVVERIAHESWRYLNLLIVFEAFPSAQSHRVDRSQDTRPIPYAYTPPICKAIKKLRRNLGIAEGCGTMNPRCTVTWAFANDIEEAARFVRCFGEEACVISTERGNGVLWGEREWLEEEEREGESDLAKAHGMNAFAALVMLYDRSLDTVLDLSPEARLADFGQLLGEERVTGLNAVIESRMQRIAINMTESVADPGD